MGRSHERSHGSDKHEITTKGIDNYLLRELLDEALQLYPAGRSCLEKHRKGALDIRAALKDMASQERDVRYLLRLTIKSGRAKPTCFPAAYDTRRAIERLQAAQQPKEGKGKDVLCDTRSFVRDVEKAMREDMNEITNRLCSDSHSSSFIGAIISIDKIVTNTLKNKSLVDELLVDDDPDCGKVISGVLRMMNRQERRDCLHHLVELEIKCSAHGVNFVMNPLLEFWTEDVVRPERRHLEGGAEVSKQVRHAKASLSKMKVSEQATVGDSGDTVSIESGSWKDSSDQRSDGGDSDDTAKSDSKRKEQEGVTIQQADASVESVVEHESAASPEVAGLEANPAGVVGVLERDCGDHAGLQEGRAE